MSNNENTKSNVAYVARITSVLLIITMFIALLLSFVNAITKDVIAENDAKKISDALLSIFPDAVSPTAESIEGSYGENVNGFYKVTDGSKLIGYYADVAPVGFKGEIGMMVGLDTEGKVIGISIISCDETIGIGTKIKDEAFLSGFIGLNEQVTYKKGATDADNGYIDGISGATYSSKAVIVGVNAAISAYSSAVK